MSEKSLDDVIMEKIQYGLDRHCLPQAIWCNTKSVGHLMLKGERVFFEMRSGEKEYRGLNVMVRGDMADFDFEVEFEFNGGYVFKSYENDEAPVPKPLVKVRKHGAYPTYVTAINGERLSPMLDSASLDAWCREHGLAIIA